MLICPQGLIETNFATISLNAIYKARKVYIPSGMMSIPKHNYRSAQNKLLAFLIELPHDKLLYYAMIYDRQFAIRAFKPDLIR